MNPMKIKYTFILYAFSNNYLKKTSGTIMLVFVYSNLIAQVNVLMNHNDLKRTGWNRNETILTTANVSGGNFGKIFSRNVDAQIYAQPLVVSNVPIYGGLHNIVLVATVNNSLYAFDADDPNASAPYWQVNLTFDSANYCPIKNSDMTWACGGNYQDFSGKMGIVGTPVTDSITNTLYVVARSVTKTAPKTFVQYLHAIDITTGQEKPGSPVYITASVPGTGDGSVNGIMTFNQQNQNQRPGLLLYNHVVYISWASHCDFTPYQGWIIGYDAKSLKQKYVYNTAPNGGLAGIWMSGQPPAVDDDGNLYVSTGNGTTGENGNPNNPINRGSSLLKLSPTLILKDFFTPANFNYLNDWDLDYGVDGVLLLPGTHLSLSGSKEGRLFLINNNSMGHTTADNSNVLQILNVANSSTSNHRHLHGSPVYFKDEYNNEYVYAWSEGALLKQFPFIRNKMLFDTVNVKKGNTVLPDGMPGAMLSVSSNGSQHGTGILWANHPIHGDANQASVPGELQAFDATDVTKELWNSNWNSKRDSIGTFAKFVPPTIANGKVYMATFSNRLNVYGLNPPPASPCTSTLPPAWQSADIGYVAYPGDVCVSNGVYTITASGNDIWNTADAFHYLFQPVMTNQTELTARIVSIDSTDPSARCGVMFRQNLDAGSPYVFLNLIPSKRIYLQERLRQNAYSTRSGTSIVQFAPYWVRVFNDGNKYISYASADGNGWTVIDSVTLAMGPNSYVGIAYTTRNNSVSGTAVVDNVTLAMGDALQVNLLNFNGKNVNEKQALLNWTTTSESQNDHFEIERSGKNTDFKLIGSVSGKGTTTKIHNYTFTDNSPQDGVNFYRLKQVDINGKATYSSVIIVNFNFRKIKIFPNPARDKIYIHNNDNFSIGDNLKIELMDFSGKIVYKQIFKTKGINIITINVPGGLANGMYIIMAINSKEEKQGDRIFINR